jgi:hypothetical protein
MAAGGPEKLQRLLETHHHQHQHQCQQQTPLPSRPPSRQGQATAAAAAQESADASLLPATPFSMTNSFTGRLSGLPPLSPSPGAPARSPAAGMVPPRTPTWAFLDGPATPLKGSGASTADSAGPRETPFSSPCSVPLGSDGGPPACARAVRGQPSGWWGAPATARGGAPADAAECERQAQYSAARILRHLALDGDVRHKAAVQACLPALVRALQVRAPAPISASIILTNCLSAY